MLPYGRKLDGKLLKSYNGYMIEKSWEVKPDGTIDKETIVYTAYTADGEGIVDAAKTLAELKKKLQ